MILKAQNTYGLKTFLSITALLDYCQTHQPLFLLFWNGFQDRDWMLTRPIFERQMLIFDEAPSKSYSFSIWMFTSSNPYLQIY